MKFNCPHCGQRVSAESDMVGSDANCPACGGIVQVPSLPVANPERNWDWDWAWTIGGWIFLSVIVVACLMALIFGVRVVAFLYPWTALFSTITLALCIPYGIVGAFFQRLRPSAVLAFYIAPMPLFLALWMFCVLYAFSISAFWAVVGIFLGGLGVVPISAIQMVGRGRWHDFGMLIATIGFGISLRMISFWIASVHDRRCEQRPEQSKDLDAV